MQAAKEVGSANHTDFRTPWKFSDLVLIVEDQKFHVHRSILAFWSPVFGKMFTSEFKEKNNDEIPLPGKKASEIELLLHMMYPSMEAKQPVTKGNCYFLFELAHEYQMGDIAQKCEAFMVSMVQKRMESDAIAMLIYGQKYGLKTLVSTCIYEARRLSLNQLKQHDRRDEIEPDNYVQITEGIIQRLERLETLETRCKDVKRETLKYLEGVTIGLYSHIQGKNHWPATVTSYPLTTDERLKRILKDVEKSNGSVYCSSLKDVAEELIALKKGLENLP